MPLLRLIPVMDLKDGLVVRGVGGRRDEYRPIVSRLTASAQPLDVAKALIQAIHPAELYLADLDAIMGKAPALATYRDLQTLGIALWVDAGVRVARDAVALADADIAGVVCGLETLAGPRALRQTIEQLSPERLIFSLDLKNGRLHGNLEAWSVNEQSPLFLAQQAIAMGIRRLIILDVATVGESQGVRTIELCRAIRSMNPDVEVYTGGGIRGADDLMQLEAAGLTGALIASLLHAGELSGAGLRNLGEWLQPNS